jgi:hypothetical protein
LTKGETLRKLITIYALGLVAIGLLASGCGGGEAGAEPLDRVGFAEQANQICKRISGKLLADLAAIGRREAIKPGYNAEETQIGVVTDALVPRLEEELKEIRALGVPTDAKKEAKAFLVAMEKGIDNAKSKPKATLKGYIPYQGAEVIATSIGLIECPITAVQPS